MHITAAFLLHEFERTTAFNNYCNNEYGILRSIPSPRHNGAYYNAFSLSSDIPRKPTPSFRSP